MSINAISSIVSSLGASSASDAVRASQSAGAQATVASGSQSFGDILAEFASGAVDKMKQGEAAAISGLQGTGSVQQVVQAVMSAEESLQTAIAIRDKVVAAYQEISRMAI